MSRAARIPVAAAVVVAGLVTGLSPGADAAATQTGLTANALPAACTVVWPTATCSYDVANSPASPSSTLDIPAGSSAITIEASGAQGGAGLGPAPAAGGKGARVTASYGDALAGQSLTLVVGGRGPDGADTGAVTPPQPGGYPDGGPGGKYSATQSGGGGGSSRVSSAGAPLVIAGGGGGAGQSHTSDSTFHVFYASGGAGGPAGTNGSVGASMKPATVIYAYGGPRGGGASGQTGGVAGGYGSFATAPCKAAPISAYGWPGQDGTSTTGGVGGVNTGTPGGGGGGGYAGGAGGSAGGKCLDKTAGWQYFGGGGGGGGGSSFASVPDQTVLEGAQAPETGDGEVVVTFTVAPTVTTVTAPTALQKSPFVVSFSRPVKGVSTTSLGVVEVGPIALTGSVACRNAADAAVSCLNGPVTTARFTPSKGLIAGQYYFVYVNPTTPTVVGYTDNMAVPTTQRVFRAKTTLTAFDYPVRYAWPRVGNVAALGGTYVQENGGAQSETFTATGPSVSIITFDGPDGGNATLQVTTPGQPTITQPIDTYSPGQTDTTTTINGLPAGTHTITVTANGTKNPASTGTWVRIDGTIVGGTVNPTPTLTASTWRNYPGNYAYTITKNATVSLKFRGTGIDWTALVGPNNGRAKVTIDGVVVATAQDLYAPGYAYKTYSYTLPDALHTITITCLGTRQPASTDNVITLKTLTIM